MPKSDKLSDRCSGDGKILIPKHGKSYGGDDELRGMQVKFGWQLHRMKDDWRLKVFGLFSALCLIWLCTALWISISGHVNTAIAFGSLVAACLTIVRAQTQTAKEAA